MQAKNEHHQTGYVKPLWKNHSKIYLFAFQATYTRPNHWEKDPNPPQLELVLAKITKNEVLKLGVMKPNPQSTWTKLEQSYWERGGEDTPPKKPQNNPNVFFFTKQKTELFHKP